MNDKLFTQEEINELKEEEEFLLPLFLEEGLDNEGQDWEEVLQGLCV